MRRGQTVVKRPLTAKSQNACRRRNTGTSAILHGVSGNLLDDIRIIMRA